ncbi:TetR/AcrR family transcriptional regulator [Kibdelosporangium persicum]|uniref:TetR family transcriptional regulator n=1 Tax=Kibdelosporangium persicum TaxID=2698649 RepID=A0ABX2EV96_9PSEU|nr:TetR/AcrR family transcriptional regulator [Kibdelosporangium persicum]NRN62950.1 TetR family transcriptional regulator [Kibdelosporangium persicum]
MTPKPGIREAKKYETRRALGFAAFDLATERGLHGFVVEDVTDRVGVSRRTFFNYFNRKEEAVVAVGGFVFDDGMAALQARPADEPLVDSLRVVAELVISPGNLGLINRLATIATDYHELIPYELAVRERMVQGAHEALVDRMPSGFPTFYALALVHAAFGVIQAAINHANDHPEVPVSALIDEAFGYLRTGFQTTQG